MLTDFPSEVLGEYVRSTGWKNIHDWFSRDTIGVIGFPPTDARDATIRSSAGAPLAMRECDGSDNHPGRDVLDSGSVRRLYQFRRSDGHDDKGGTSSLLPDRLLLTASTSSFLGRADDVSGSSLPTRFRSKTFTLRAWFATNSARR